MNVLLSLHEKVSATPVREREREIKESNKKANKILKKKRKNKKVDFENSNLRPLLLLLVVVLYFVYSQNNCC